VFFISKYITPVIEICDIRLEE